MQVYSPSHSHRRGGGTHLGTGVASGSGTNNMNGRGVHKTSSKGVNACGAPWGGCGD